jgi:multidrug resistance efflux pump
MTGAGAPKVRAGVTIVEQVYRGERSAIVRDPDTRKHFRLRAAEGAVLRAFDGVRTPAEVAASLAAEGLRVSAASVESFARTCARLGLLERTLAERTTQQLERLRAERHRRRSLVRGELLRMRFPMSDPDRWLARSLPWVRWCFTPAFVAASALLFVVYLAVIAAEWPAFTAALRDLASPGALGPRRIGVYVGVTLVLTYIHEMGHAYACKRWGGEVHEMGFMVVFFQPAFYCNVNDAWSFPELRHRLWVTGAGAWIEVVVSSAAALVWWAAQPGTLLAEVALIAMLVGGVSTIVANANPLLPLDGYYALSDWLDIPNLRRRAPAHAAWWVRRHVLGVEVPEPAATPRERRVLLVYGALSAAYVTVMLSVTAALAVRWSHGALGPLAALLVLLLVGTLVRRPVRGAWAGTRELLRRARAAGAGGRRRRVAAGALVALLALVTMLPWRRRTSRRRRAAAPADRPGDRARAGDACALVALLALVTMLPWRRAVDGSFSAASAASSAVVVPVAGVVTEVLVREGDRVRAGAPLLRLTDPAIARERETRARRLDSLVAEEMRARALGDVGEAARLGAERVAAGARAAVLSGRAAALVLLAPVDGEIATPRPESLLGRRLRAGTTALSLVDADSVELRIAVGGRGAALVRAGQEVRLLSDAATLATTTARIASVAASGHAGTVEARARLARTDAWRPGATGEARVLLGRTTVLGALWWNARAALRSDIWL